MGSILMQIINSSLIAGKKVLLRLDIDVPLEFKVQSSKFKVKEDFRLKAGIPTLNLCLQNALSVTILGHIGRPEGKVVEDLKVEPIRQWLVAQGYEEDLINQKLILEENLRFNPGEEECNAEYAQKLADKGDIFINEAFASYRPAASTTVLPGLLPHAAGLRFAEEVRVLTEVRDNSKKPFIAITGGAKVEDKLPVIKALAQKADAVLVGGKLVHELRAGPALPPNVFVSRLNSEGTDIDNETIEKWRNWINKAVMIVWNGPVGKTDQISNIKNQKSDLGSAKGTYEIAKMVLSSQAEIVVGGGDTVAFLGGIGMLGKFEDKGFVSVGGGAMLKFLTDGTLPTIEALS